MRILYVSRLFSGLAKGIRERRWDPRGVPTVYRLLEKLDQSNHDLRIVFTVKDDAVGWPRQKTETLSIDGFGRDITVIPQCASLPPGFGRARGYLRELIQYREICKQFNSFKPDLVYFDRVNIYQAALSARRSKTPVVWRVMGVPPAMHSMLDLHGPVGYITRKAYRAPFSMVICSRDGSGGEQWMNRALAPNTPRKMMINGVTPETSSGLPHKVSALLEQSETSILFVARLVEDKGCLAFIDAVSAAMSAAPKRLRAFVAGSGILEAPMRQRLEATEHADRVHFLGQVPHTQVLDLQQKCDVYVSLNQMGNLTNANLEAMGAGISMIIPASPDIRGIDVDTDKLMPPNTIWRIRDSEDVKGLRDALIYLDSNPDERRQRAEAIFAHASTFIPSWDERINAEIELLEELAMAQT